MVPACGVLAWDRQVSAVTDPALALADLLALVDEALALARMPADLPVVATVTVLAADLLAAVVLKVALKAAPAVVIVVVPRVDLAMGETADLTVVLLTMAGAAVTVDRIADLRVIVAARKTKRSSCG
ncbi:MAG: hypothetical protein K8R36_00715 [Planctomycetales bacterium]|nr:hypothetical protein [Planctomycetales bacterium]